MADSLNKRTPSPVKTSVQAASHLFIKIQVIQNVLGMHRNRQYRDAQDIVLTGYPANLRVGYRISGQEFGKQPYSTY
jgi:hypothetical protein